MLGEEQSLLVECIGDVKFLLRDLPQECKFMDLKRRNELVFEGLARKICFLCFAILDVFA